MEKAYLLGISLQNNGINVKHLIRADNLLIFCFQKLPVPFQLCLRNLSACRPARCRTPRHHQSNMPCIPSSYRGPALLMGAGCGFAALGGIPVAVTMLAGNRGAITIIGMGFVGFGMMLILPGLCWCILVNRRKYAFWRKRKRSKNAVQEKLSALG